MTEERYAEVQAELKAIHARLERENTLNWVGGRQMGKGARLAALRQELQPYVDRGELGIVDHPSDPYSFGVLVAKPVKMEYIPVDVHLTRTP